MTARVLFASQLAAAFLLVGWALATAAAGDDDKVKAERKALEGKWVCVSSEVNGVKRGEKESAPQTIVFKGESCTQADEDTGHVVKGTYSLALSGKRKVLTTTFKSGETKEIHVHYIYERTGDGTLKMCCNLLPGKELPTEYSAPEGSKRAFLVFNRAKEKKEE